MSEENLQTIDSLEAGSVKFEVVEYPNLKGSDNLEVAQKIFFANQAHIHLKFVRASLNNGSILIEPGALSFMKGRLELESKMDGGLVQGLFRKVASGETLFQSTIVGTGTVYLEPSFGHFILLSLDNDELIMDDGIFYAASDQIKVTGAFQKNVSSALFGGESLVQTSVKGSGAVVVSSPVPVEELIVYELEKNEKLHVDGNFALMRTAEVRFSVEKSGKSLFQSLTSGEGLLQTFVGPGTVGLRRHRLFTTVCNNTAVSRKYRRRKGA